MTSVLSAAPVLAGAADDVNNFGDTRGGALAGPLGLFIVILLSIATVLLIRNMNKRLRRLPASFPDQDQKRTDSARADSAPESKPDTKADTRADRKADTTEDPSR